MTRWLWHAADGSVTDLSAWSAGNYVLGGAGGSGGATAGELAPEYEFATQEFAGIDGAAVQQISAGPRTMTLGCDLIGADPTELRNRVRALTHALRPRAGIGSLQAIADDGTSRSLLCYYRKGLEAAKYQATRCRAALEFWAPVPWWVGDVYAYTWAPAAAVPFFPILPLNLSASSISGQVTVDLSDTDAPTFPLWTVLGPASSLTLTNTTTGQSLVLNAALGDGQGLVIDTRPGLQSIKAATLNGDGSVASTGASLFASLASDPALWALLDGVNVVTALLAGAGPASRVWVSAARLYSGAR